MGYIKAEQVLPQEIIELIQQYVDGTNIYIPRKEECRTSWGEGNNTKMQLQERNEEIYKAYINGQKVSELSKQYFLSEKSIWRIVSEVRKAS